MQPLTPFACQKQKVEDRIPVDLGDSLYRADRVSFDQKLECQRCPADAGMGSVQRRITVLRPGSPTGFAAVPLEFVPVSAEAFAFSSTDSTFHQEEKKS